MNQGLIPARYAKALFDYAAENGKDTALFDTMQTLAKSFELEPSLGKVMANPFVSPADKVGLLDTAAGPGAKDEPVFQRFMKLLAQNGRIDAVREIALAYIGLYRRRHGIKLVTVTSAAPLDPADEARLKAIISSHLGGATMEYRTQVDPDLIGGFTVAIDNEKLDASVANELKQLRQHLLSN